MTVCGGVLFWFLLPRPYAYYYYPWLIVSSLMIGIGVRKWKTCYRILFFFPAFILAEVAFCLSDWNFFYTPSDIKELRTEIKSQDKLMPYGSSYLAMFNPEPEHYYWYFLADVALWDNALFHYTKIPEWNEMTYKEKPLYIISHSISSLEFTLSPHKVMQTDFDFINKYYERLPTKLPVWKRKN